MKLKKKKKLKNKIRKRIQETEMIKWKENRKLKENGKGNWVSRN